MQNSDGRLSGGVSRLGHAVAILCLLLVLGSPSAVPTIDTAIQPVDGPATCWFREGFDDLETFRERASSGLWVWSSTSTCDMPWGSVGSGVVRLGAAEGSLFGESNSLVNVLLTPAPNAEVFQVETSVAFAPPYAGALAGVILYNDDDNFVILATAKGAGDSSVIIMTSEIQGRTRSELREVSDSHRDRHQGATLLDPTVSTPEGMSAPLDSPSMLLGIRVNPNACEGIYSTNAREVGAETGELRSVGRIPFELARPLYAGVFAWGGPGRRDPLVATFDDFSLTWWASSCAPGQLPAEEADDWRESGLRILAPPLPSETERLLLGVAERVAKAHVGAAGAKFEHTRESHDYVNVLRNRLREGDRKSVV